MENAIEVKDLKIRYRSFKKLSIKKSLFKLKKNETEIHEAVRGVTFNVEKGQIMGIVGKNGSGKSTLLRALAGIFSPDYGSIDLHGHSVSLLALGVGFQRKLTGRENIVLAGMLLGFSETEVREKMHEIIKFADLGKFIDRPVSTYSSGMYSKLSFAITVVLETEIMLIDEVLSVGDVAFQKKSSEKMKELISNKDRTVVIVSHNLTSLNQLCDSILWLNDGQIMMQGPTKEVLTEYKKFMLYNV
jgi:ABC-type polysaccharide/polyol phosphate transport system ATPase subunit